MAEHVARTRRLANPGAPKRVPKDRQAVEFDENGKTAFTNWLTQELEQAIQARSRHIADGGLIDRWHELYEQASRPAHLRPWPDAADLASYIPTEKVDAYRARLIQVVFGQDPIAVVEGWGESSERVAKVEAFHQWKAEDERLRAHVAKTIHQALIEGCGILEVNERLALRKTRGPFKAQIATNEFGQPALGDDGAMQPKQDDAGAFLPWSGNEQEPYLEIQRESVDFLVRGPQYATISLKDFLFLPAHARNGAEVWGFAKRFHLRLPDLQQRVKQGLYDADAVQKLGTDGERDPRAEHAREGIAIAEQQPETAEKELWEFQLLHDIDGDGIEEWLIVTYSHKHRVVLRCAFDELAQTRYTAFTPFPRATSVYGYSFVGHKLWTLAEEHTALRNMKADRQALALNAPITRLSTSIWDPEDQPFGPSAVLDVRSHDDIKHMTIQDVPASTIESERTIFGASERVSGLGDTAVSGLQPDSNRTATEHNIAAQASFVRIDEAVGYTQESIQDLYELRHVLWKRALAREESGVVAPDRVLKGLETRGIELPQGGPFKFTAADLEGSFRFKPRGSVANADKRVLRQDLGELVNAVKAILQFSPALAQQFMANPAAAKELLEQALRLWDMPNLQPFLQANPAIAAPQGVGPVGPDGPAGALPPGLETRLPQILAQIGGGPRALLPPAPGVM